MSLLGKLGVPLLLCVSAATAEAHGLHVHTELRGNQLRIEAWFDDDTPAEKAKVKIVSEKIVIREGLTDEKGLWFTEALPPGKYQIQVDAGAGHRRDVEFNMTEKDASGTAGPTKGEVKEQQWIGVVAGLLIITLLILLGKYLLRHNQAERNSLGKNARVVKIDERLA
jgi:hypothetical protein